MRGIAAYLVDVAEAGQGRAGQVGPHQLLQLREREKYYTYPALRLIQVLPGHPLADPKRRNSAHQYKEGQAYESTEP